MKNYQTLVMFISTLSILVTGFSSTGTVHAQGNQTVSDEPKFLAIQHAQSGSISQINDTAYSLELNDVSDKTILFSDRPDRIVTSISTDNFIGNWSVGEDSFADDAPNAVLVVDDSEVQNTTIIELFDPAYDVGKGTLRYDIIIENATSIDSLLQFAESTIVIDNYVDPAGCDVESGNPDCGQ